ncbi:unnamed protein product [Trifolium pratense]|uniref:Uncharacterized protein n=1 Tax=Trifolium pratense TaxID=57577 RepID=A0ACB0JG67_TRIPR|nr:unnamed protein product [Trifolium pratense]
MLPTRVEGAEKGNEAEKDDGDVYKSHDWIFKHFSLRCLKLLKWCKFGDHKFCEEFKEKCLRKDHDDHQTTVTKSGNPPN